MTATYRGIRVRVVHVETHRATIVWQGMLRRVNRAALEDVRTEGSAVAT